MPSDPRPANSPTLSVVVPTYRESANVPVLFERMKAALDGLPWEMIVVDDDSPDGTSDVSFAIAAADPRLRCLRRVNRTGLAGAVIEGWMASSADYVAVIDGDLQHDEKILPRMYGLIEAGVGNLAIGTRVRDGAERGLSPARQTLSDLGKWVFTRIAGAAVSDPMSGFFMIRREIVSRLASRLS
ncbi:MAG TPA: glycosyltransferase, partial [Roseiarcus sp.]|nr:glycosyltransferase [Roseiarcus sp.]